ncbi:MAG: hypothetical protein AB7S77_08990 [Desulfatirhabdiaceae bacterium]
MPYISSVERIGYKRGLSEGVAQGVAQAIELGLSLKYGDDAAGLLMPHIHNMHAPEALPNFDSRPLAIVPAGKQTENDPTDEVLRECFWNCVLHVRNITPLFRERLFAT